MKKLVSFLQKWGAFLLVPVALVLAEQSANVACTMWFHQPVMPKGMERYKKQR